MTIPPSGLQEDPPTIMHRLIAAHDWRDFSAGAPGAWPQSLKTIVEMMLRSKFPMWLIWKPDLCGIYNDAYIPILGERHPAALGAPWPEVWKDGWPQVRPMVDAALASQSSFFEDLPVPLIRDGQPQEAHFTFSYSPIRGDEGLVDGMLCVCHETTAIVKSRESHRSQNENLLALFQQAPGFMAIFRGPEHVIEMRNDAYMALVGDRSVVGKPLAQAVPEAVEQGYLKVLDDVYASGKPFVGRSLRYDAARHAGRDKEEVYVDLIFQPIFDDARRVTGIFLQGSDVTEQYRNRQALMEADRQKDRFIATLAHELRNPLAPIRMASRLLESPDLSPATLANTTQIIARQVEQMARLLDDLLDVARIAKNQMRLQKEAVSLRSIVALAIETARPLVEAKKHRMDVVHHDGDIELDADPVRLTQVISNLLCNAAKYTDRDGAIFIASRLQSGQCIVTVRDTGVGIKEEALSSVFDLFAQEEHALDRSQGGLGIGLGLVKGVVELHGGSVFASSDGLGQGSTFTVLLPGARLRPDAVAPARVPAPAAADAGRTILIADDSPDLIDVLTSFLEALGHRVTSALDGLEALALAERTRPEIAILDIGMPGLNGYQLAQALRATDWGSDLYLVAATGWGNEDDKAHASTAGFDMHLTKPYDMRRLEQILQAVPARVPHSRST